jgi:hypothetical protein
MSELFGTLVARNLRTLFGLFMAAHASLALHMCGRFNLCASVCFDYHALNCKTSRRHPELADRRTVARRVHSGQYANRRQ